MKRSRDAIIRQILDICKKGASKTQIVYQVNLNFRTVIPYLHLLIQNNLLEISSGEHAQYKTTKKGMSLLEALDSIAGYTLVTRSGHEVYLEGDEEGINKKFEEILNNRPD